MTSPFQPPGPETPVLPNPAGRLRVLPVPLAFIDFPELLPAVSFPPLPVVFAHVPVGDRQATQYAHCKSVRGQRSQIMVRYGSATKARNWSTKSTTIAMVWIREYFFPSLAEVKDMALVVGFSNLGPFCSDWGGGGLIEAREVGAMFGWETLQPR
jgi:hypothetical protein